MDYRNKVLIGFVIGLIVGLFAPPTSAQVIDDFESYSTGEEMEAAWHNPSPALWNVSLDTLLPGGGVQSMRAVLVNHGGGGVSFLFPPIQGPVDLTGKVIFVWVRGDGDNPENSRAFLQLYDGTEWCNGMNRYITLDRWQQLEVDPAQCNGFNTSDVEIVSIGIGGTTGVTSDLVVNIDDLSYDGEMGSMFSDGFESGSTSAWSG